MSPPQTDFTRQRYNDLNFPNKDEHFNSFSLIWLLHCDCLNYKRICNFFFLNGLLEDKHIVYVSPIYYLYVSKIIEKEVVDFFWFGKIKNSDLESLVDFIC